MKRLSNAFVTRDIGVTSRVHRRCDIRDVSRVSHATTTTPHHTMSLVQVVDGSIQDQVDNLTVGAAILGLVQR